MDGVFPHPIEALTGRIASIAPTMAARAAVLDRDAAFPTADMADLAMAGALTAPFPARAGGMGIGTAPAGATGMLEVLRTLGRANLAVGRVFEAHVNAIRLIVRYGTPVQTRAAAEPGRLYALWVTDPAADGLRVHDGLLRGCKEFCSAAGHATHAVVTAADGTGPPRLMLADVRGVAVEPLPGALLGMRAATTGRVHFDVVPAIPIGQPGDYLREPDFSTGAWRTSAVTLGGLEALAAEARAQLTQRGRHTDPHQQARMGQVLIAEETARLWMRAAALRAENADDDPAGAVAYVNLARLAVERACLDTIELVQRSLGLAAFMRPNPVERLCRDLATYLRQPAGDMVLTEAAAHAMANL